jgi:catechol 2,3-dioxygenase-like lactoylglutathione lyase family enzyme
VTRLVSIVVDSVDHRAQARWWAEALGTTVANDRDDEAGVQLPCGLWLDFVPDGEPGGKRSKNRIHLDLATYEEGEDTALVERLVAVGATRLDVGQPATGIDWVVLADPEGNELCVLGPRPHLGYDGPLACIVFDTADPAGITDFWVQATGYRRVDGNDVWVDLRPPDGRGPHLALCLANDPKPGKNRIHLDVAPLAGADQEAEVEALVAAGGRRLDIGQGDVPWVVLADPVGNELCVLTPR